MYELQKESKKGDESERTQNYLVQYGQCMTYAYNCLNISKHKIFTLTEFRNKTCFQILHVLENDQSGVGLFMVKNGKARVVNKGHPIHARLEAVYREDHGSPRITRKDLTQKKDRSQRREDEIEEENAKSGE